MSENYRLIAGLGNPGRDYAFTRHNMGFLLLDWWLEQSAALQPGCQWKRWKDGQIARLSVAETELIFFKPLKYMNLSGIPIAQALEYLKIAPAALLVVHDEVDLPWGLCRLKRGGGAGGHRGIASIKEALGDESFDRLRLGIGRPEGEWATEGDLAAWVLGRLSSTEMEQLPAFLEQGINAIVLACTQGFSKAQNEVNRCP